MYLIIENEEKNAKTEQNRSVAQTFVIFRYGAIFHHFVTPTPRGGLVPSSITLAPRGKLVFVVFTRSASRARFSSSFCRFFGISTLFRLFRASHYVTTLITVKRSKTPFSCPMPLSEVVVSPCRFVCRSCCSRSHRCLRLRRHQHIEVSWSGKLK